MTPSPLLTACAQAAHEVRRAFAIARGLDTFPPWADAAVSLRDCAIDYADAVLSGRRTPADKLPYSLPPEQIAVDLACHAVIHAMAAALGQTPRAANN